MPRKKQTGTLSPGADGSPARIQCPACKSEISADGSTLHSRSKQFAELVEDAEAVEKLEKVVADLETKLAAAKQAEKEAKEKAAAVAVQTKPEGQANVGKQEQQQGKQRGSWW